MLNKQTVNSLYRMKLRGMAEAYQQQQLQPDTHGLLSFEERFSMIVDREAMARENRKVARLLHTARLGQPACIEDIDYLHPRGLERSRMASLTTCEWIRARQNICIVGPTGSGKSWLACALGNHACRHGLSVRYERATRLFDALRIAKGDGSYAKRLAQLAKTDLLILDDWGMKPLAQAERHDLLELMDDRHGKRSTLVTSQLPIQNWYDHISDPTIADAVLDRLLHAAHKLVLYGESMRKLNSKIEQENDPNLTQREHSE